MAKPRAKSTLVSQLPKRSPCLHEIGSNGVQALERQVFLRFYVSEFLYPGEDSNETKRRIGGLLVSYAPENDHLSKINPPVLQQLLHLGPFLQPFHLPGVVFCCNGGEE